MGLQRSLAGKPMVEDEPDTTFYVGRVRAESGH
jgi:hypothetical protein